MRYRPLVRLMRHVLIAGLILAFLTLPLSSGAYAQIGGTIGYGSLLLGNVVRPDQPLTYSFSGAAGDSVQIVVRNWTGTIDPQLELVMPDGVTTVSRLNNPFSGDPLEAALALFLPQTGTYSLRVGGEHSTTGEFILRLQGHAATDATALLYGQPIDVVIPVNPQQQVYAFETQACPTILTLTNLADGFPFTFPFFAVVRDDQGTQIAHFYGGDAVEDRLIVPGANGSLRNHDCFRRSRRFGQRAVVGELCRSSPGLCRRWRRRRAGDASLSAVLLQ
ncbi:MAG: PPC domain-containing protein [Chloroflexi bacterium]|nr:PPC domain-containing protein [Chloroflexota bacterium]